MSTPVGPYSPVVRSGDLVFSAGQIGLLDGKVVSGGLRAELTQAMTNLASVLAQEHATLDDVVKTTVFLTDIDDYAEMNEVYTTVLGDHRPARSAVAVAALPAGACVEIEAIAVVAAAS
ncbi:MAG: Rid family detoxifying hydrolase [Acidimicrobiales bacterium]|nr:Rid family detoxifying hydrolase [Acidimicrobiales bacterium]